jgi:hypothetical protein
MTWRAISARPYAPAEHDGFLHVPQQGKPGEFQGLADGHEGQHESHVLQALDDQRRGAGQVLAAALPVPREGYVQVSRTQRRERGRVPKVCHQELAPSCGAKRRGGIHVVPEIGMVGRCRLTLSKPVLKAVSQQKWFLANIPEQKPRTEQISVLAEQLRSRGGVLQNMFWQVLWGGSGGCSVKFCGAVL